MALSVNTPQTIHIDRHTILYGQTPKAVCRQQLIAMAEAAGMTVADYARHIVAVSTDENLHRIQNYHTTNAPHTAPLFHQLTTISPPQGESVNKVNKSVGSATHQTENVNRSSNSSTDNKYIKPTSTKKRHNKARRQGTSSKHITEGRDNEDNCILQTNKSGGGQTDYDHLETPGLQQSSHNKLETNIFTLPVNSKQRLKRGLLNSEGVRRGANCDEATTSNTPLVNRLAHNLQDGREKDICQMYGEGTIRPLTSSIITNAETILSGDRNREHTINTSHNSTNKIETVTLGSTSEHSGTTTYNSLALSEPVESINTEETVGHGSTWENAVTAALNTSDISSASEFYGNSTNTLNSSSRISKDYRKQTKAFNSSSNTLKHYKKQTDSVHGCGKQTKAFNSSNNTSGHYGKQNDTVHGCRKQTKTLNLTSRTFPQPSTSHHPSTSSGMQHPAQTYKAKPSAEQEDNSFLASLLFDGTDSGHFERGNEKTNGSKRYEKVNKTRNFEYADGKMIAERIGSENRKRIAEKMNVKESERIGSENAEGWDSDRKSTGTENYNSVLDDLLFG